MGTLSINDVGSGLITPSGGLTAAAPPPAVAPQVEVPQASNPGAQATTASPASAADVQQAVATVQQAIQPSVDGIEFSVDSTSGQTVVRVVDSQTGTLIRQIPSQEMLDIANSIDKVKGLLLPNSA